MLCLIGWWVQGTTKDPRERLTVSHLPTKLYVSLTWNLRGRSYEDIAVVPIPTYTLYNPLSVSAYLF